MKFKLDEELWFSGRPMRVAGVLQLDAAGTPLTRYLLAPAAGAPQIVEESAGKLALLRPFPPGAIPEASGGTVTVMGARYALDAVRKLKIIEQQGQVPGGAAKTPILLSGVFAGEMGGLLREIAPGSSQQTYYSVKPVDASDLLTALEQAKLKEAERLVAEQAAQAAEEEGESGSGSMLKKAASWGVSILIVVALVYACSGPEDDGSSGSARGSFSSHGGK